MGLAKEIIMNIAPYVLPQRVIDAALAEAGWSENDDYGLRRAWLGAGESQPGFAIEPNGLSALYVAVAFTRAVASIDERIDDFDLSEAEREAWDEWANEGILDVQQADTVDGEVIYWPGYVL